LRVWRVMLLAVCSRRPLLDAHLIRLSVRGLFSESGVWERDYKAETRRRVEQWWHGRIQEQWQRDAADQSSRKKFYVLSMFPYPSGRLHMGHVRVYTISDTISHFQRMRGHQVLNPMGWDAFGLPAENAAIERGLDPEDWTKSNIESMRKQLDSLGLCFNWDRVSESLHSTDGGLDLNFGVLYFPDEAIFNRHPADVRVLSKMLTANVVDVSSISIVFVSSCFLFRNSVLQPLLDALADLPEWYGVKSMQANWIGDCSGCFFNHIMKVDGRDSGEVLAAYTGSPEAVFGAAYVSVLPSHRLLHGSSALKTALLRALRPGRDSLTEVTALNVFTGREVPVVISSKKEFDGHLDTVMGIPDSSEEEAELAQSLGLSWISVLKTEQDGTQTLINSDEFTGQSRAEAFNSVTQKARERNAGGYLTSAKLRDWLISRQRYWGTPIPIVHCSACGPVPVPVEELPVTLPKVSSLSGKGASPLKTAQDWLRCQCPRCKGPAERETDTMDTFVDSSWYYFRYTDPQNPLRPFEHSRADHWMPVDVYIGGKEHAVMHLYYARFLSHFCRDQGMVSHREPFRKLLVQGLIKGQTFRVAETGQYLTKEDIDFSGPEPIQRDSGSRLQVTWEKMSKSKQNGLDPQEVLQQYGLDTMRLYLLYAAPPEQDILWDVKTDAIPGVLRWQARLWGLITKLRAAREGPETPNPSVLNKRERSEARKIWENKNYAITQVTGHFTEDFLFNAAISRLMGLTNTLSQASSRVVLHSVEFEEALASLCVMAAPMCPHLASELWAGLSQVRNPLGSVLLGKGSVLQQPWPSVDPEYLQTPDTLQLSVRINNKACGSVSVPREVAQDAQKVQELVLNSSLGARLLSERVIKKAILSPRTALINFLVDE
uniref:leucine--tRNA ligase n=1 Tax=Sinocyclocheilus anshuiensis TaxID=1608454 RepID=A0A671P9C2_9TELE